MTSTILAGNDIAGDGSGYENSSILQSVIAWNEEDAVWYLDLRNSQNPRMVHLNFTNGIANTGPNSGNPVNPGSGDYKVWMYTPCNFDNYNNVNLLTMPLTTALNPPVPCPMAVQFEAGGKRYLLRMNSFQDLLTNDVTIARPSSTTWLIRPSAMSGSNRARLHLQGKGNAGLIAQGDYNMSFAIDITNP